LRQRRNALGLRRRNQHDLGNPIPIDWTAAMDMEYVPSTNDIGLVVNTDASNSHCAEYVGRRVLHAKPTSSFDGTFTFKLQ
jgi:hypothetical protein